MFVYKYRISEQYSKIKIEKSAPGPGAIKTLVLGTNKVGLCLGSSESFSYSGLYILMTVHLVASHQSWLEGSVNEGFYSEKKTARPSSTNRIFMFSVLS